MFNKDVKRYFRDLDLIYRACMIVWNASKFHTTVRLVITVFSAIFPLVPMYLMKYLLDYISGTGDKSIHEITWIIISFGAISLFMIILKNIAIYNSQLHSEIVVDYMSKLSISKSISIDFENFDSDIYHDKFARAMAQAGGKPLAVFGTVIGFFQSIITITAMAGILIILEWWVILILVAMAIPISLIKVYYMERNISLMEEQTQKNRKTGYLKSILTGGGFAKEVRAFGYGEKYLPRYIKEVRVLRHERRALYWDQARTFSVVQATQAIAMGGVMYYIAKKAIDGIITIGDISLFYQAFGKAQGAISGILGSVIAIHEHKLTLMYLYEFLDLESKLVDPESPVEMPKKLKSLKIENLSFKYPSYENEVLKNINIEFKSGEIIAIVGENGSGKTTLVKLINRLYFPSSGHISFNDININQFRVADIKSKISTIFQKFSAYALTIKENIQISNIYEPNDDQKLIRSGQMSKSDLFVDRLENKYDTQLGRSFKDGHELSGGQWQRIALARAFYRDTDIIILDEPTSRIDPLTEFDIFQNLKQLAKEKILILITHRIYNLKLADKIVVLKDGRIIETGSHIELIQAKGEYYRMFEKQSST